MRGEHVVDVSPAETVGRFSEIRGEEGGGVAVPYLGPCEDVICLAVELVFEVGDILIYHLLIDLDAASIRIEVQHSLSDLSF